MVPFIATVWFAPHDLRGHRPQIVKKIPVTAMNWPSARKKVRRALDNAKLTREAGYEVGVMQAKGSIETPACWQV